ncbi:hypothetical protein METP3_01206 [Methanosarcinales archaeon]|nr:MAG: hypothetical protein OI861_00265 [Candidatus Methanoperedens sp.]CAG0966959.1 hypothetical protein METP3_01206 [Methanosarcinales archaeon]
MISEFKVNYLEEPKLLFNNRGEAYNPCIGLIKYGPRFSGNINLEHKQFKVGIIGSNKTISQTRLIFESFEYKIHPRNQIRPWKIPFPGLNKDSPLRFSFIFDPSWEAKFTFDEFNEIEKLNNKNDRAEYTLNLIKEKMISIYNKETPPDIILICIPDEIFAFCTDNKLIKPIIKIDDDDFHNRIKLIAMKLKMPTQLIRPETLQFEKTQERFLVAWNLVVGMLYKCQKGHPWKLTYLEDGTCYVGISFFKEKGKDTIRASLAQIFLDTGESFVLRGESFSWANPKFPKSPHLSRDNAINIIELVLKQYKINKDGKEPQRIVIHKSSNFWDDELEGFKEASKNIPQKDFIAILESDLKFFTIGKYPILRGTLISSNDYKNNFLFTTGFVPSLETYPGLSIPRPLLIRPFQLKSDITKICKEILSFTKLDWNNTFVYSKYPVTLSVSEKVGNVMAESSAQNVEELDSHYFYYM